MNDILTFNDTLKKCPNMNKCYLLLGNGFSTSLFPAIFSYKSLKDEADFTKNPELAEIFDKLGTPDFEKVIHALEHSAVIGEIYKIPGPKIKKLQEDANDLKSILVSTIADRHPEDTTKVTDEQKKSCNKFLNQFKKIYTLNYDVLLYWVLLHGKNQRADDIDDGFRLPDDDFGAEYRVFDSPHSPTFFFLHGALHIYDSGSERRKYVWVDTGKKIISQVREAIDKNLYPLFVAEGNSDQKKTKITHDSYLSKALRSFEAVCDMKDATVFIFGHSLNDSDEHIFRFIKRGKVPRVFIGVYKDPASGYDKRIIQKAKLLGTQRTKKYPLEVILYDAQSANVWGSNNEGNKT